MLKLVDPLRPAVGNLENITFALMSDIHGSKWYEEYLKNPVRSKPGVPNEGKP